MSIVAQIDTAKIESATRLLRIVQRSVYEMTEADGHPTVLGTRLLRAEADMWESHGWLPFPAATFDDTDDLPQVVGALTAGTDARAVAEWFQLGLLAGQTTHQGMWCDQLARHLVGEFEAHRLSPYT